MYDSGTNSWYNQPQLSFAPGNVYVFNLDSTLTGSSYKLVFGTDVDSTSGRVPADRLVEKPDQIIVDLDYIVVMLFISKMFLQIWVTIHLPHLLRRNHFASCFDRHT